MTDSNGRNSNGVLIKSGLAVSVVVGAIAVFTESMRSDIEGLEQRVVELRAEVAERARVVTEVARLIERVSDVREDLSDHEVVGAHNGAVKKLARMEVKFEGVQASIQAMKEMESERHSAATAASAKSDRWQATHDQREIGRDAAQWERIRGLERQVFGEPLE